MTEEPTVEDPYALGALFSDAGLDESALKEMAKKVRRTMRARKHFSRQDRPLKRSRSFVLESLENLRRLAAFTKALEEGDWSEVEQAGDSVEDCIDPFLSFYRSHGKLPEIDLDEALAYVLYVGVVEGKIILDTDLQLSTDTPRGSYGNT